MVVLGGGTTVAAEAVGPVPDVQVVGGELGKLQFLALELPLQAHGVPVVALGDGILLQPNQEVVPVIHLKKVEGLFGIGGQFSVGGQGKLLPFQMLQHVPPAEDEAQVLGFGLLPSELYMVLFGKNILDHRMFSPQFSFSALGSRSRQNSYSGSALLSAAGFRPMGWSRKRRGSMNRRSSGITGTKSIWSRMSF